MSLSPVCTINGGSTPADVSASTTVNGALQNAAGVGFFAIRAVSCDELLGPAGLAAINTSLVVNQTNKTFSYSQPSGSGHAVIFMVTVGVSSLSALGAGRDANGNIVTTWTTTFKVNVPAANGVRVLAGNEESEQDSGAGWAAVVNPGLRLAGTGGGGGSGSTTTSGNFVQPTVGGTQSIALANATSAIQFKNVTICKADGTYVGTYTQTSASLVSPVTLLKNNPDSTGVANGVTVLSGAVVTFGGQSLPSAAVAPLAGQVAQAQSNGTLSYVGMQPVVNLASFNPDPTGGTLSRTALINGMVAAGAANLPLYVPYGKYVLDDVVLIPNSVQIISSGVKSDATFGHTPIVYCAGVVSGKYWGGSYLGPAFLDAPNPSAGAIPYIHAGNFWWTDVNNYDSTGASHQYLVWSQTGYSNLNGLTAMTLEWMQAHGAYAAAACFPAVQGGRTKNSGLTKALQVAHFNFTPPGFGVNLTLTTVNGVFTAGTADQIFSFNTDYGCCLSYDGANFRMYRGPAGGTAVQVASVAATGAIVQNWWEDFMWAASGGPGLWPYNTSSFSAPMRYGNMRLSTIARHTGSGSYSLPTTEFVAADVDTHTNLMTSFAPAYTTAMAYPQHTVMSTSGNGQGFLTTPINIFMMFTGSIGVELAPALNLSGLAFSSYADCILAECAIGLTTDGCLFQGGKGLTSKNNGYYGRHTNHAFYMAGSNAISAHAWGMALVDACGIAVLDNLQWASCTTTSALVLVASGGATRLSNTKINTVSGQTGLIVRQSDLEIDNLGMGDEGSAGVQDSLMIFDTCQNVSWIGGGAFPLGAPPSAACIRIDGGTQYSFNIDLASFTGSVSALVKFDSAPTNPLRLESAYQGQGIGDLIQWASGTGTSVVLPSQEMSGVGALTFAADADFTLSGASGINGILFGTVAIGGHALTASRTVTIPRNVNKRTRWNNTLTQQVTIVGPSGTGFAIPASTNGVYTFDNGTNIVQG